jgi:hypothetical protein
MKIRIKQCSQARYWYRNSIGEVFDVYRKNTHYWVRATDGYTNLVELYDADEVGDERIVRVLKCSNPVLWYAGHESSTFEVTQETDVAYWVKLKRTDNQPIGWIYKTDCEVL